MSVDAAANRGAVSGDYHFLREALEESLLPATIGLYTAGPVGAASSLSVALGLFFSKKAAQYFFPELRGNRVIGAATEMVKLSFTALNSASLIRSDHCEVIDWPFKSGNFLYDAGKTALNYTVGFAAKKCLNNAPAYLYPADDSAKAGIIEGVVMGITLGLTVNEDELYAYYCCK